ncbi:MAG TPA: protein kinase, partial [Planctomycetota bacterium]|nr:protein kinase [Planctomycetota bacterium]
MDDRDDPTPPPAGETLADLVARCIVAAENGGDAAMAELLAAQPELAAAAGAQLQILAHSGLLAPRVEPPTAFGPYRVLRRLGSGGMGEVFLAEQQQPLCRQVAVKVIRAGMDTRSVLARFAVERQALALLDHPNIAKVLDAGVTADGRPYLVMDYIAGESITRYCDLRQLSAEARIALFAHVCDVVQHAHHKGIMHRDLKPSNVLVGDRDGRPWPVVIDFGVAKSVGGTLPDGSLETRAGQLIGTPEYMSPEQASGAVDVDTRTDVFSLGVLLYELLTGVLPIAAGRLRGVPAGDIPRILRETEAPTPSTRITGLGDQAAAVARCRSTDIATLRRRLRGDLDWIALKALARDRNQRYGMPGELAADLRRHLLHEPVTAGPPRTWYRWQKFLRRNRLQVGAAAAVFVAMAGGLLASLLFYQDAAASAVASDRSLDDALAAVGELVQVGDGDLADVPHLEDVRRRLLERAVSFYRRFLDRAPADDPRLVPRIIESTARLGAMEARLGHYRQAEPLLREAVARSEPWLGNGVSVLAQAENLLLLAGVAEALADRPAIEPLQRRAQLLLRAEQARAPDDADAQLLLLRALKQHGATAAKTDPQQALSHLDQAMALVPPLLAAAAHRPRSIVPVLELGILRARVLLDLGRRDDALAAANAMRELRAEALPEAAGAAPDWQAAVTGEELAKLYG